MTKQNIKRFVFLGIPLLVLVGYLCFIFVQIHTEEKQQKAQGIKVVLKNPQFHFISEKQVLKIAEKEFGDIKKQSRDSINRNLLESKLKKNPFVENVQVFLTASGVYRVEIQQRTPFFRILTDTATYYLDKAGYRMPAGRKYPCLVRLYKGNISEKFAKKELTIFEKYLEKTPFWNELIDYVAIDEKQELILYLKIKSGTIYFGKVGEIAKKLEKLKIFIAKLGKFNGMDSFEKIDLRFENQIVVKKK